MQRKRWWLFCCLVLMWGTFLFLFTCDTLFPNPADTPKSVTWISIKTGLTDSFALNDDHIKKIRDSFPENRYDLFAAYIGEIIDSGGFDISWNGIHNASYYEIRLSKKKINESNWGKAILVATAEARPTAWMRASIKVLRPKIKGNNCTGCQYCVVTCPNNAVTIINNKAVIDVSLCTGCGRCYDTCDFDAITDCFMGEAYYFAVRSFSSSDVPSLKVTGTKKRYLLRYTCWHWKPEKESSPQQICGACGAGCYILTNTAPEKGCPVGAILYDKDGTMFDPGMVYIDQSKCIYCGNCVQGCIFNSKGETGNAAIRREVIAVD